MELRKRLKDFRNWCPQPPDRLPSKLKGYSAPLAILLSVTLFTVSFSVFSFSSLTSSSVGQVPVPLSLSVTGPSFAQLWSFKPAESSVHNPAMANGLLYVTSVYSASDTTTLYCIDPITGVQVWNSTKSV